MHAQPVRTIAKSGEMSIGQFFAFRDVKHEWTACDDFEPSNDALSSREGSQPLGCSREHSEHRYGKQR